jgi:hypothetical protein
VLGSPASLIRCASLIGRIVGKEALGGPPAENVARSNYRSYGK